MLTQQPRHKVDIFLFAALLLFIFFLSSHIVFKDFLDPTCTHTVASNQKLHQIFIKNLPPWCQAVCLARSWRTNHGRRKKKWCEALSVYRRKPMGWGFQK